MTDLEQPEAPLITRAHDAGPRVDGPRAFGDEGLLLEHGEYLVSWPGAERLVVQSRTIDARAPGLFVVRFGSETGLVTFRALAGGRPLPHVVAFEVVSRKLGGLAEYRGFSEALADDLFRRGASVVFRAEAAPTAQGVGDGTTQSVLFALHHFLDRGPAIRAAVRAIVERPHVALVDTREPVPLGQVSDLDLDVLLEVAAPRGPSQRVAGPGPLRAVPLEVWARRGIETTDNPENRFAKWVVTRWLRALGDVLGHPRLRAMPGERRERLRDLQTQLHEARRHATFDGVGPMRRIPLESRVLSRREGYRALLPLLSELERGRSLLFGRAERAIEQRELWRLYEQWTFFRMIDAISAAFGQPAEVVSRQDPEDLAWKDEARWKGRGVLLYNPSRRGYAVPLRPDLLWESEGGSVKVVFDAKFQTKIELAEDAAGNHTLDSHDGPLHAMHVYRDGLGVRAAIALYPGTVSRFFHADRRTHEGMLPLAELLEGRHAGVGYWAMRPDDGRGTET